MSLKQSRTPEALAWVQALRAPALALRWTLADWERVVRLARRLRLLARLSEAIDAAGLLEQVPTAARRHLVAEQRLSRWRTASVLWAIERMEGALGDATYPRVLLKGAAYLGQGLPIAAGRLPSDIDILVPRPAVADAQQRLRTAGWSEGLLDPHDRMYYYEWSHEVPPMTHPAYHFELDLHHNIVPPMAHASVDPARLMDRLMPSCWPGWQVLDTADQVLHSAAHLFWDSELRDRLRDLVDLDGLLRLFGQDEAFWPRLVARASETGLAEPLALAFHFTQRWLDTPIPDAVLRAVAATAPGALHRWWLVPALDRALFPTEPDEMPSRWQKFSALLLLTRHHYRRMPMRVLLPHLWQKWRVRQRSGEADEPLGAPR
jgi:hypothetical protein